MQAPVAGDLRTILAAVYCAEKIERMGDLAAHIADTARFTHPEHTVPAEFTDAFAELDETDQAIDALHARALTSITGEGWQHRVRSATSLALLARLYERFADQAVSVAKRLEFAETGQTPTTGA